MKFKIQTITEGSEEPDWEEYTKNIDDPQAWAEEIVNDFNRTLRPGERPRTLLKVEILEEEPIEHSWVKRTDGQSKRVRGRIADLMYCRNCGITGKRYGLSETITIDSKYRAKVYQRCDTAKEHLRKKAQR